MTSLIPRWQYKGIDIWRGRIRADRLTSKPDLNINIASRSQGKCLTRFPRGSLNIPRHGRAKKGNIFSLSCKGRSRYIQTYDLGTEGKLSIGFSINRTPYLTKDFLSGY